MPVQLTLAAKNLAKTAVIYFSNWTNRSNIIITSSKKTLREVAGKQAIKSARIVSKVVSKSVKKSRSLVSWGLTFTARLKSPVTLFPFAKSIQDLTVN